jgi:DNA repair protein RadD
MQQLDLFSIPKAPKQRYDYQNTAINEVIHAFAHGVKRVCLVLPTGAGKTFCTGEIIKECGLGKQCFLVPKVKLKTQAIEEFRCNQVKNCLVDTIQAINPKVLMKNGKYIKHLGYELIIMDECHMVAWWQNTDWLVENNPDAYILGVTATPDRTAKKEFIEDKFDEIIYPVHFGELVDKEKLCNPRYFVYGSKGNFDNVEISYDTGDFIQEQLDQSCEKDGFIENIIRNLVDLQIQNRKSIIFCASIPQSKIISNLLNHNGIRTIHLDGATNENDQESALKLLADSPDFHAVSCAKLLIEGFDLPRIDTVVLATAMNSRINLVQMCGRGSRLHPDKNLEFWVIDFGDNFARLKMGLKQKFPYKLKKDVADKKTAPFKICSKCKTKNPNFARVCIKCDHEFDIAEKPIQDVRDLDLIEVAVDFTDIYHLKQIRAIVRNGYKSNKSAYPQIAHYANTHKISNIVLSKLLSPKYLKGAVFKTKALSNYLDYTLYAARMYMTGSITYARNIVCNEFGDRHKIAYGKLIGREKFYDSHLEYFDLMPIQYNDTKLINQLYQEKLKSLSYKLKTNQQIQDGENDIDGIVECDENHIENTDLNQEIMLLQWAYDMFTISNNKQEYEIK